jgi:hypothetical protein
MGCDIHLFVEERVDNGKWEYVQEIDVNRNYDLFGFLAGVRDDNNLQHFPRKGFPNDASKTVIGQYDEWDLNGHSHSWLTLEELQTVNWDDEKATIKQSGVVRNDDWDKFQESVKSGKPDYWFSYSAAVVGKGAENFSYHEWECPLKEQFDEFIEGVVKYLPKICETTNPNDIRIVFWFDN